VVWPLALHPVNRNEVIVWDLAHDPRELATLDGATVRRRLFSPQAELPAGEPRLPIKSIHINKSPIVIGNLRVLGDAAARWGLDLAQVLHNAEHARTMGRSLDGLWPGVYARPELGTATDVDEDLYGGFIGNNDRRTLQRLRELGPAQLAARRPAFDDPRLDELLFRYRARNFPESLDEAEQASWQRHCAQRLGTGGTAAWTLPRFVERVSELGEAADERGRSLLQALRDYADGLSRHLG
jgi:exodeoxyribonuclease-1